MTYEENVFGETLPVLTKADVDRVLADGLEPGRELLKERILVAGVLVVEEHLAFVGELLALLRAFVLKDPTRLKESL